MLGELRRWIVILSVNVVAIIEYLSYAMSQ